MTLNRALIVFTAIIAGVLSLHAQPAAVQQLQNSQILEQQQNLLPTPGTLTNAPELYRGENLDVGPQRILRRNPTAAPFDVLADSQVFYTDNANFADTPDNIGSYVFVNTIQLAYAPEARTWGPGKFAPSIGLASQWYNYSDDRMRPFDFDAQTVFINAKYNVDNWQFGGGVNFTRLVDQAEYHQTYREFMPTLGVQRIFPINDKLLFILGGQLDYHFTRVPLQSGSRADINNRLDAVVNLSLNWQVTKHVVVQPFYRFQYSYYPHDILVTSDRNDELHNVGITVAWYVSRNLSLRTFFSYNFKQTDDPVVPEFNELNGGLGVSLDFKF